MVKIDLEKKLEQSKKDKTRSIVKSVCLGTLPLIATAGALALGKLVDSHIDDAELGKVSNYINNFLPHMAPYIDTSVRGLRKIIDYLVYGSYIAALNMGPLGYWYHQTEKAFESVTKSNKRIRRYERKLIEQKESN